MTTLILILIILSSVLLGIIILIQSPKGGGLASNIAGFSNQFMGVKQTTDFLEKGTWIFSGIIIFLCLISSFLITKPAESDNFIKNINTNTTNTTTPQTPTGNTPQLPAQNTPVPTK